jgi:hypothetical protein
MFRLLKVHLVQHGVRLGGWEHFENVSPQLGALLLHIKVNFQYCNTTHVSEIMNEI